VEQSKDLEKIHHSLEGLPDADHMLWYVGLFLGLPRVFMSVVRRKIVQSPVVESILIPLYKVWDPVTEKDILIPITDRYFFIGTKKEIYSEEDIGASSHINTIMLLRGGEENPKPSCIDATAIRTVIRDSVQKRKLTIQPDLTVCITAGAFRDWFGQVEGTSEDREHTRIRFSSDDYSYATEIPTVLCKVAS
jgi:hypothetical protein